ncbi:Uncharacterized protein PECH_000284 [Penicillium ucsense]|uniref:Family A G protein-coupled receptor-like protein n=1 Tax=Penicillium ucsense TaxID=2839758 RepID=A0A8J8W7E3_9EURO|nr:Uncharacterized protein PECM_008611 [Penicillium ucsense]KAF7738561.1 Uncharacterized protein PECH_000284 [Penicillium ucsense]
MDNTLQQKNNVFNAQPKDIPINITTHGSDWYWAVCAVMFLSTFAFFGLMLRVPRTKRLFHYITGLITFVAGVAYFTMASNLGSVAIPVEFQRSSGLVSGFSREIFYARYIDWFITTPLILTDILLTCGLPWPTILFAVVLDEIMIVTGLIGALVKSQYKWGYFTIGCVAFFMVAYVIIGVGMSHAKVIGQDVNRLFIMISVWTLVMWTLYPVAWGLCEGGNVISPDSEAVFYGVLDLLAKPVFGGILLWGHSKIDPARLGLRISDVGSTTDRGFADVNKPATGPLRDGPVPTSSNAHAA